ncbi:class I SAM-dependent methyltransferase [Streptomyces sp. NRRL S-475]|uniref:class I SAM-dependent methyltransferase n=1 Tax=Streptomyces sp. NRRL S-475 TaxID=1463910 RepID=UPI000B2465DD|nr:class I SAM-dependent methyltransferase [Streptomyces sp. NRRL S-475]
MLDLLPPAPASVLDVGAGTGRDAAALALRGYQVIAAEPVRELRAVAQSLHPSQNIRWAEDSLPELSRLEGPFELALLSAVWMHLLPAARGQAMERLAALLAPSGLLVISLRRGAPPTDRVMFDVPAEEVVRDGKRAGLRLVRLVEEGADRLGRAEVWWQTVALHKGAE